jgi:alpha-L-rhamnosidase
MKRGQVVGLALMMCVTGVLALTADVFAAPAKTAAPSMTVTTPRVEYKVNPLGIDARAPRFSWQLTSDRRGGMQSAYQVIVATSEPGLRKAKTLVWDSGQVKSDVSNQVPFGGPALQSGQRYYWQVRVWDGAGVPSAWSAPAFWEMGLLTPADWKADWIEPNLPEDVKVTGPSPMLRREFLLKNEVKQARAYVTSHGLYEMFLNGKRVGDQVFTPGWTAYDSRLQYQTYDVTALVKRGPNAIGATLGNGWYRGDIAWSGQRNTYGSKLGLLAFIRVTYTNGREEVIGTDAQWKASTGPILMSEIYHGETYDARLEKAGWTEAGFKDADWTKVAVVDQPKSRLIAPAGPAVRKIQELKPIKIFKTPGGDTVADLGQNMVGWVRLTVDGPAGTTITLRHAEVLDKAGNFYTENLRAAKATARYTLKGGGKEVLEPHFTFFGFRYVAIDGYPGVLTPDNLTGVVIHSDMAITGTFETSNPEINQLQHNILWGQKGNFLDVPTDCPQRDERLGWTGDAQAFSRTAAFNMDVAGFFTKWLGDVAADQWDDGRVPHVVPNVLGGKKGTAGGSAAWGDVAVIAPWNMYLAYGDTRLLEQQYPSMVKWVEFERARAGSDYIWDGDQHFGDWLAFASTDSDYPGATTGKDLIATAMWAHSTSLLEQAARALGKTDDAAKYHAMFEHISQAFIKEFVSENGRVGENTQTAYVLALEFNLLPESRRAGVAARLAREVRERKHLTTGFVGTPYLCHVLRRFGYLQEAYMLLNRRDYPSWLYPVSKGATTIWERWDGLKPDGSFQDQGMNSFNHYAYGAIGDWMYSVMGGIDIDAARPGYKHVLIQPEPGGGFTSVKTSHVSMYGTVSSAWTLEKGTFALAVELPANTTATVRIPNTTVAKVTEGGQPVAVGNGITAVRQDGKAVVLEVGSGRYAFSATVPQ